MRQEEKEDDLILPDLQPREEGLPPVRGAELTFVPTFSQVPLFRRDPEQVVVKMPGAQVSNDERALGAIRKTRTVSNGMETPRTTKEKKILLPPLLPSKAGKGIQEDWPKLPGGPTTTPVPSTTTTSPSKTLYSKTVRQDKDNNPTNNLTTVTHKDLIF